MLSVRRPFVIDEPRSDDDTWLVNVAGAAVSERTGDKKYTENPDGGKLAEKHSHYGARQGNKRHTRLFHLR